MSSIPEVILDTFKELLWDNLIKAALTKLYAAIPLFAWGPFSFIIEWLVRRYAEQLYGIIREFIALETIALKNEVAHREYRDASIKLRLIAKRHGIDSKEFQDAREIDKAALAKFVSFN